MTLGLELPTFHEIRRAREANELKRQESQQRAAQKRSYEAARLNRLNRDWTTVEMSANWELRRDLRVLRARSKWLARNDDYIKKFLSMVRSNVAGPAGIKLQARARDTNDELDRRLNKAIEYAWTVWSHPENCSVNGKLSWADAVRKAITMIARDGECLVRMMLTDNPFGYALKFYSAAWLDETFCDTLLNGNRVIMSVELDALDRPVAYWLTPPPSDYLFLRKEHQRPRVRVEASEIVHCFLVDDENSDDDNQTRGVPWMHTAMKRLKMLGGYEEAELVAARIGACKMGFYTEEGAVDEYTGEEDGEKERATPLMETAEPGTFGYLPNGIGFKEYTPDHPNTGYKDFVSAVMHGLACGLDVNYFSLTGDLSSVNYSSARIGLLQERDVWQALQNFMAEHFCRPIYLNWLRASVMKGALRLSPEDMRRLYEPHWQPRGWKWVDPMKEVQAKVLAINNGLDTRTNAIEEQGGDIEETLTTLSAEQKLIAEKEVQIVSEKPALQPADKPEEDLKSDS